MSIDPGQPASVSFRVSSTLPGKVEYKLLDLTGTTLLNIISGHLNKSNHAIEIPVTSLSPGMYFLMAGNGSVRLSKKVLISR
ncbi:MAG TPA: T9SS type A sorting domain-containing protein [Bacteroidetes bacterium]|nr:T9SS type A sorting domain-containing protein [Bacteroidota bacterium]